MPAKDHTDYYYVKFSAYAELDGEQIDITGMDVAYALNSIPTAQIYPTVGREPQNNKEAKAVEALLAAQPFTPIKLYATFDTDKDNASDDPGFPYGTDDPVLLFDGFITGVTYQSTRSPAGGSVSLVAGAMGWLAAMRGTSAQTTKNTIKGPGSFAEAANLNNSRFSLFNTQSAFKADAGEITTDIWTEFIKPFYYEILETPSVWGESPNDSASAVLDRMDDEDVFFGDATNDLPFSIPTGVDVDTAVQWVGQNLGMEVFGKWRNSDQP